MNKKFATLFNERGMQVSGNYAHGIVDGYETNALISSELAMHISFYATEEQKLSIQKGIRALQIKFLKVVFTSFGLTFSLSGFSYGTIAKKFPQVWDSLLEVIKSNGALTSEYCPVCGNPFSEDGYSERKIDGFVIKIDNDCVKMINTVIAAENEDFKNAPNNYGKGFLGAFIGGVVGAAIAIMLYFVGYFSAISSLVAVILGAFLYQKFKGKPNKMMILIVALTSVGCMVAAHFVCYIIQAGIIADESNVSMSAIEAFFTLMTDKEFARYFIVELFEVLVFAAIGVGIQIFYMFKMVKRKKNI